MRIASFLAFAACSLSFVSFANGDKIAHFSFDEGFGTTSTSSVGGYVGTLMGPNVTWGAGVSGTALQFAGTDDSWFDGTYQPEFLVSQGSLEAWVNFASDAGGGIVGVIAQIPYDDDGSWDDPYIGIGMQQVQLGNYNMNGHVNSDGTYQPVNHFSDPLLDKGVWHHFVVTFDGNDQRLYVNGALFDSINMPGSIQYSGSPNLVVGVRSATDLAEFFQGGLIDEVALYNHALSPEEVLYNYNNPGSNAVPEPASWALFGLGAAGLGLIVRRRRTVRLH